MTPDVTLVVYASNRTVNIPAFLAELFHQEGSLRVELIVADGGSMRIDFEKVGHHCREHGIEFSTVRQDPMTRFSPGFNVAAHQARGHTLAFVNPGIGLPLDYLKIVDYLGRHGKVVLPRAWMNVASHTTECWGVWAPPDGMSLILPNQYYSEDLLGETVWETTAWPKADAYILAARLATRYENHVGMATIGDFEYRRWLSSGQVPQYMPVVEPDFVDVHDWILQENDIRRYTTLGASFGQVTEPIPGYQDPSTIEQIVRKTVAQVQQRHVNVKDPQELTRKVQRDLDLALDRLFERDIIIVRPTFVVEPVEGQDKVRVRSTGDVLLPHEPLVHSE